MRLDDETEFVLADLPGLIEGASEGAGLGTRFLGHVERCAVVLHLIDGTEEDVVGAYRTIRRELAGYGHGLADKPEVIGAQQDRRDRPGRGRRRSAGRWPRARRPGTTVLPVSGVSGAGLPALLGTLVEAIREARAPTPWSRRNESSRPRIPPAAYPHPDPPPPAGEGEAVRRSSRRRDAASGLRLRRRRPLPAAALTAARRVVVKIGSALLVAGGRRDPPRRGSTRWSTTSRAAAGAARR